jgi:hypothetical protein
MLTHEFKYSYMVKKKSMYNAILLHHFPHEYYRAGKAHQGMRQFMYRQIHLFFSVVLMTAASTFRIILV